jgi:hypothetical protein
MLDKAIYILYMYRLYFFFLQSQQHKIMVVTTKTIISLY